MNSIICFIFSFALVYFLCKLYLLYINRIVRVECWFCREFTPVNVKTKNCFFCSSCLQYNGFTSSGDYNRILPAQHDARLNSKVFAIKTEASRSCLAKSEIFCSSCHRKLLHKIEQLANFEPSSETNWDKELEQFKKDLEIRCMLCSFCTHKAQNIIDNIDVKLVSKVLSWWRRKNHSLPFSIESNDQFRVGFLVPSFSVALRIVTILIWLYLSLPFALNFFDSSLCKSTSFFLLKPLCHYTDILKSISYPNKILLRSLEISCLISHLSLLFLQTLQASINPFFALLDAILFVLSTNFAIVDQIFAASPFLSAMVFFVVFAVIIGVLIFTWLPYVQEDLNLQTKQLKAWWPAIYESRPPSFTASPFDSKPTYDDSLSLNGLSLNNAPSSASDVFAPPVLSPPLSHDYAASASPTYSYLCAKNVNSCSSSGVFEADSRFLSISQVSKLSRKERKRRHRRPTGLLRWATHLLFGRLETWGDVKAELVCLSNAVLLGVLLMITCRFFYIIMSALWTVKS